MAHVGLYFGSFNPIHNGHLIIAQHMLNEGPFDEIWFVVSPQNPFKEQKDLLPQNLRLDMVKAAVAENPQFRAMDIEFRLPLPSYTIHTVEHLLEKSNNHFSIIMGSDNLPRLHEWKDIDRLFTLSDFHVYNRLGSELTCSFPKARIISYTAPFLDISATHIRGLIEQKKSIRYLVPEAVRELLTQGGYGT
jgi:nicotinate-nucleotide adenylyltransferase